LVNEAGDGTCELGEIELGLDGAQRRSRHLIEPRDLGDDRHLAVALDRGAIMRRLRAIHHHAGERQSAPPDGFDRQ
jgi:hypothetical protein